MQPTDNVQAHDYLLQGDKFYRTLTRAGITKRCEFSRKAAAADPTNGDADALNRWTYFYEAHGGWATQPQQALARASELAQRLTLDNSNISPFMLLSCVKMFRQAIV
jgi:hypothetical protein